MVSSRSHTKRIPRTETPNHPELIPPVLPLRGKAVSPRNNASIIPSDRSSAWLLHFISAANFLPPPCETIVRKNYGNGEALVSDESGRSRHLGAAGIIGEFDC